jgi:hypothetical protein
MMVPWIFRGLLSELHRLLGAPLQTGQALLTFMIPDWLSILQGYIVGQTYLAAYRAVITFFIYPKFSILTG